MRDTCMTYIDYNIKHVINRRFTTITIALKQGFGSFFKL
jgi:hypothetical protein